MLARPFLEILQAFVPLNCKMKVEVGPSPDSAGGVVDAVGCAKSALHRGIGDALVGPRGFYEAAPQFADDEARSHRSVRQHDEQREYAPAVNLRRQSVSIR